MTAMSGEGEHEAGTALVERAARAFWLREPGRGEIRPVRLPDPGPGDVLVRTLRSGISRGTESLVFRGAVPREQQTRMRAPFQEGEFPSPVKYGYLSVGAVEEGPADLRGRTVFCLYPHQTAYVVPAGAVSVVPDDVPPARAVLAGTVETAVNALWDAAPAVGDRVAVVGGGMVGCCVARLLRRYPAVRVTLVDVDPGRAAVASALGVDFALPDEAPADLDLVVHTSATSAGLQRSLDLLGPEGAVVDLSWYGDTEVRLSLGGAFHSRRLAIRSSQVGTVAPARASRRSAADRLALALELLRDPAFDALLTGESRFEELPDVMARLVAGRLPALCHTITYGEA
jgi:threonine dehydrogenase-like Zn-dependent dehydrogenase